MVTAAGLRPSARGGAGPDVTSEEEEEAARTDTWVLAQATASTGASPLAEAGMDEAEPANGKAAPPGAANEARGAGEDPQQGSREPANGSARSPELANGRQVPGGWSNEGGGSPGAANKHLGAQQTAKGSSNGSAEGQGSTNEDGGLQDLSNEIPQSQDLTNETWDLQKSSNEATGLRAPSNENTGLQDPTNEAGGLQDTSNGIAGCRDPTNEVGGLQEPSNGIAGRQDPTKEDSDLQDPPKDPGGLQDPPREAADLQEPSNEAVDFQEPSSEASGPKEPSKEASGLQEASKGPAGGDAAPAVTLGPWDLANEEAWLREPCEEPEDDLGAEDEDKEENEEDEGEDDGWWQSPDGAFSKRVLCRGRGLERPGPGSRCRVLLEAPAAAAAAVAAGLGRWVTLQLGAAEGIWAAAVDACLETMAAGERARLRPAAAAATAVELRLATFAPAPEAWEQPPAALWAAALARKARAGRLFGTGAVAAAARQYGAALRLAVAGGGRPPLAPEQAGLKADLHANLALCQLRLGLPAPAAANCAKALALRPGHLKARYRRGLAAAALGDLEAAAADLAAVARARPGDGDARRELQRVGRRARERDARLARRLRPLFASSTNEPPLR